MNIAIIDADLIGRNNHRFPNLACMKISGFYKQNGDNVILKTDFDNLNEFDNVFISKVFLDTAIPEDVLNMNNVKYGGTGFYYDKAPKLPYEIEHHMPDYHLYDDFVKEMVDLGGGGKTKYKYYTDYSIGFLTRGCFRKCQFCVNQNYNMVESHSPLSEFLQEDRKKICLLDDNFFGYSNWKELLSEIKQTNKPFQFKQGLDERLLTEEKCEELFSSKYEGTYIFAFDNIADSKLIEQKMTLARKYTKRNIMFYVFCGYDRTDKWDMDFWKSDIFDIFKRVEIIMGHKCIAYIMRYFRYQESPYRGMYVSLARWCNQPSLFKKLSFREFCVKNGEKSMCYKYMVDFEKDHPDVSYYFDMKFPN